MLITQPVQPFAKQHVLTLLYRQPNTDVHNHLWNRQHIRRTSSRCTYNRRLSNRWTSIWSRFKWRW